MPLDDFARVIHGRRYHPDDWRDLVRAAERLGRNVDALEDRAFWEEARHEAARHWQRENQDALLALTDQVEREGVFSDAFRRF